MSTEEQTLELLKVMVLKLEDIDKKKPLLNKANLWTTIVAGLILTFVISFTTSTYTNQAKEGVQNTNIQKNKDNIIKFTKDVKKRHNGLVDDINHNFRVVRDEDDIIKTISKDD